jgi:hypothetical protein
MGEFVSLYIQDCISESNGEGKRGLVVPTGVLFFSILDTIYIYIYTQQMQHLTHLNHEEGCGMHL